MTKKLLLNDATKLGLEQYLMTMEPLTDIDIDTINTMHIPDGVFV